MRVLAREREGEGVAFGRRVVLMFGVSVGCDDSVADILSVCCLLFVVISVKCWCEKCSCNAVVLCCLSLCVSSCFLI